MQLLSYKVHIKLQFERNYFVTHFMNNILIHIYVCVIVLIPTMYMYITLK